MITSDSELRPTQGVERDTLYDMEVSLEQQFYFKVMAAFSMAFRSKRPPARIFKLFGIGEAELNRFAELFPEETAQLVVLIGAACIAALFFVRILVLIIQSE